jgi:hypothetical protein
MLSGTNILHVPYKVAPRPQPFDVGFVQVMFDPPPALLYIISGSCALP